MNTWYLFSINMWIANASKDITTMVFPHTKSRQELLPKQVLQRQKRKGNMKSKGAEVKEVIAINVM